MDSLCVQPANAPQGTWWWKLLLVEKLYFSAFALAHKTFAKFLVRMQNLVSERKIIEI